VQSGLSRPEPPYFSASCREVQSKIRKCGEEEEEEEEDDDDVDIADESGWRNKS
jgi:hypothetical protein